MECPSCKAQNPDDSTDCAGCGIVFAKWRKKQGEAAAMGAPAPVGPAAPTGLPLTGTSPAAPTAASGSAAPEAASGGGKLTGLLMVAVGLGLGWWLLHASGAGDADKQGLQDPKAGYAINPPAGWEATARDGCTVEKAPCVSIDFEKKGETEGPAPAFQVALLAGPPKRISEGALEELAAPHKTRMSGQVRDFTQDKLAVVDVGGLKAMRFEGSGKKKVKITIQKEIWTNEDAYARSQFAKGKRVVSYMAHYKSNLGRMGGGLRPGAVLLQEGIYEDRDVDMVLGVTLVPGRKVNYRLTASCQEDACDASEDAVKDALASFREFKRPRPIDYWGGPNAPLSIGLFFALPITIIWGLGKLILS